MRFVLIPLLMVVVVLFRSTQFQGTDGVFDE